MPFQPAFHHCFTTWPEICQEFCRLALQGGFFLGRMLEYLSGNRAFPARRSPVKDSLYQIIPSLTSMDSREHILSAESSRDLNQQQAVENASYETPLSSKGEKNCYSIFLFFLLKVYLPVTLLIQAVPIRKLTKRKIFVRYI